jgi:hypothetical protein
MADYVEFTPEGLFAYKWNGKNRKNVRFRPKKLAIGTFLRSRCEIVEGTTLRNIFDTVDRYKLLKLIIAQYSWCRPIEEFHAQAREPMQEDPDDREEPLTYLEIYHHPEIHQFTEKKKHPGGMRERITVVDFDTSVGFHGVGPTHEKNGPANREDGNTNYSVSYSPMWKLADLPMKLNKEFTVYEPFDRNKHKKGNPPQELLKATREFSLLDVLDAIYWDISFVGGPAENAEFIAGLKDQMEEIKSGNVPMIPMEQVFKDLKDEDELLNPDDPPKMKVLMHPDVARAFGVDPDSIPLDDKEIIRPDEE